MRISRATAANASVAAVAAAMLAKIFLGIAMTDTALTSFSFAKLVVADLDASRRFYETVTGVSNPQEISSTLAGRPLRELIYNDANGRPLLILFSHEDDQPAGRGDMYLGFATPDIDGFVGRALANGGKLLDPAHVSGASGSSVQVAVVADPEGHWIEVVQVG
jgi:catechol 2,3-dioxygenase-like lactoylglutathione lyase family enzyme